MFDLELRWRTRSVVFRAKVMVAIASEFVEPGSPVQALLDWANDEPNVQLAWRRCWQSGRWAAGLR